MSDFQKIMDNIFKDKLQHRNGDKGYGFIGPENEEDKILIHLSALKIKSRHPLEDVEILYQLHIDSDDKNALTDRLLTYAVADLNQLKKFGVVENVLLLSCVVSTATVTVMLSHTGECQLIQPLLLS